MEKYHSPWDDNRALSGLLVVVLLLVITIILSAILAVFVTATLPTANGPPSGDWRTDSTLATQPHQVTFRYAGPERIDPADLRFVITGAYGSGTPNGEYSWTSLEGSTDEVTTDSALTLDDRSINGGQGDLDLSGATIELRWEPADSSDTTLEIWRPAE